MIQALDPLSGTALADMWLHSEYTDSRDGRGAGGKWSMLQAYLLFQKALVSRLRCKEFIVWVKIAGILSEIQYKIFANSNAV